jgi:hypothetical protein
VKINNLDAYCEQVGRRDEDYEPNSPSYRKLSGDDRFCIKRNLMYQWNTVTNGSCKGD